MPRQEWERLYLDALLRSRHDRIREYESTEFVSSVITESPSGVQELLLHRTISSLTRVDEAVKLITLVRGTPLASYGPRILARVADTEALLRRCPELENHLVALRRSKSYTVLTVKNWRVLTDNTDLSGPHSPVWAGQAISILNVIEESSLKTFGINELTTVLDHVTKRGFRMFQLALLTSSSLEVPWAETLHQVLAAPYLEIATESAQEADFFTETSPAAQWAPHWHVHPKYDGQGYWSILDVHTGQSVRGIHTAGIFDQISILLALTGLLRDGINLSPIDRGLVRALEPSHPLWGFRNRDFAALGTTFRGDDIRALALGFLEGLSADPRVSVFRSRLAVHFATLSWSRRASASVVTAENGFYKQFLQAAQLLNQNRFEDVLDYVNDCTYGFEAAFQFLHAEAAAALSLMGRLNWLRPLTISSLSSTDEAILCVTHASVPEQTGGYAIRAHGILQSLQAHGVNISAVTRPGFPAGALTEDSIVTVDDVEYRRLPATPVTRVQGEIQHMNSFIEPFKSLFKQEGVGIVHLRSTFLIALPALIAAKELGLKVLYEVSGLWELVYKDREADSLIMKRSPFAEYAEKATMNRADQLIVMNEAVRRIALERGVDPSRIHVAHNAVDVESFIPLEPPQNEIFTLGYLGSFQDYEGLDDILDAVKVLQRQNIDIRVLMVGDGYRFNFIRARIAQEGLEGIVTLTGRVPHSQVLDYYRQMDALVYPRRSTGATETITPLKPFEALALAKPIIVSDVSPLKEIVGDNERGLLFESGNVEDLAKTIMRLKATPYLRTALGQAGREWVVRNRNWENVVETFIGAYSLLTT